MMKKLVFLLMLSAMMMYIPLNAEASKGEGTCQSPMEIYPEGPAIVGTISLTPNGVGGVVASFSGKCMGEPFVWTDENWPISDLSSITETSMEGFPLPGAASVLPEKCQEQYKSADKSDNLIISNVTKFSKTDTAVVADVVILFAVCR
jgi:hypothetical protein